MLKVTQLLNLKMNIPINDSIRERERHFGMVRGENRIELQDSGDVKDLLLDIRSEMRYMNRKFDNLETSINSLKQDNKSLKKQNKNLTQKVETLTTELQNVTELARENERKNEKLESQSRRENLKFFGLEEARNESWEESETKVRNHIAEGLNIDDSEIRIERAHRLTGSKSVPKPIIVKFSFFKDKEKVLRTYREKKKATREARLAGQAHAGNAEPDYETDQDNLNDNVYSQVRVAEDFVERVTNDRTKLFPFMQDCLAEGKNAFLRYDKLVVDDVVHVYDSVKKVPVAVPGK